MVDKITSSGKVLMYFNKPILLPPGAPSNKISQFYVSQYDYNSLKYIISDNFENTDDTQKDGRRLRKNIVLINTEREEVAKKFYAQEDFSFKYISVNETSLVLHLEIPDDYIYDAEFPLKLYIKFKSRLVFISKSERTPIKQDTE